MSRVYCLVSPGGTNCWVGADGSVWNHPTSGTAWRKKARFNTFTDCWEYSTADRELVLQPSAAPELSQVQPIGLRPTEIAWREFDRQRCEEIGQAIARYTAVMSPIPTAWLDELDELTTRNQPEEVVPFPTTETVK